MTQKTISLRQIRRPMLAVVLAFAAFGCGTQVKEEKPKEPDRRTDLVQHWQYDVGSGVPHRMSVLRDSTEFLSIGQYNHGDFVVFVRHAGEDKFVVVNPNGIVSIE